MRRYEPRAKQKKTKPRPKPAPAPQLRRPELTGRRPSAPKPKPTPKRQVKQARAQERTYGSPAVSNRMARDNRRTAKKNKPRRERLLMQARRRKYFPKDALKAGQRSQRSAIQALSDLKAQDPEKYERKQRSWASNAARDVGDYLEDAVRSSRGPGGSNTDFSKRLTSDAASGVDRGIKGAATWANRKINSTSRARQKLGLDVPGVDKLVQEALDIGANAPSGTYITGDAIVSALKGDRRKLKKLGKDFEKSSALVPLVKGDLKEAYKRGKDRPLTTFLELSGGKAVLGRGGGALMRKAPSQRLRRIASTERAPQRLYTEAETKQRFADRKVPVGGTRGPAVNRDYSRDIINKGIQVGSEKLARRRARDPNVDRGIRVVPGHPRWRRQLDREVDRQAFSASRTLETIQRDAAKKAKKAKGPERERLLVAARADKIRTEVRGAARLATGPRKRALLNLLKLTDRKLIAKVEHGAAPRLKGRTTRQSPYTKAEQAVAVKSIDRRARRGKPLGPQLTAALKDAGERHVARDVAARRAGPEFPSKPMARSILDPDAARAWDGVERRAKPRPERPSALAPEDFASYFEGARHPRSVPRRYVAAPEAWQYLNRIRAADEDIVPTAVGRAVNEAGQENVRLIAEEFGIPVGKRGYVTSFSAADRAAHRAWLEDANSDLVPLRVADNKYMLWPRRVAERFEKHDTFDRRHPTGTPFETGTRLFKDVVLTSSSPARWLGGNVADIGLRSLNEGSGIVNPFDMWRGRQIGKGMRSTGLQGEQAWANMTGGGLHGVADDLASLPRPRGGKANVPVHTWRAWKGLIYKTEHAIEKAGQTGMVGKAYRRDNQRQVNSLRALLQLEKEALERYGKGIGSDRAFEARVARQVEDMIGRWGKVSPAMRRTLALAPFAQWLGAATRYVYVTLPVHHPIKTGILAGIMQMTEPERRALGLSYFAEPADRAPDYQMGMLPQNVLRTRAAVEKYAREHRLSRDERESLLTAVKHGPVVKGTRTARMTSFGTAANPGEWPGFILPQIGGAMDAMSGTSFTGEPLEYPGDYPEKYRDIPLDIADRIPVAAGHMVEGLVPFASMYRRAFLEGGQPSEPYSTILTPSIRRRFNYAEGKYTTPKGSVMKGLKKWVSPVSPEGRIYTLGAQRDIDATQKAKRKIKQWNEERQTTPGLVDPWEADAAPAAKQRGQIVDPWDVQPRKKKRERTSGIIDPWAAP